MTINKELISISELAKILDLVDSRNKKPLTHTLRFWESKFKQIKPTILKGGRRYYSKKDVEVVKMIFYLLKDQKLTIEGAVKVMNNKINQLDDSTSSSIKSNYHKKKIITKSGNILSKLSKIIKLNKLIK
jgi:DNA-binding transcriptional MerR regulator